MRAQTWEVLTPACLVLVLLRRLLAEAHQQLEQEAEARNRLEENMKRAFMRGASLC